MRWPNLGSRRRASTRARRFQVEPAQQFLFRCTCLENPGTSGARVSAVVCGPTQVDGVGPWPSQDVRTCLAKEDIIGNLGQPSSGM